MVKIISNRFGSLKTDQGAETLSDLVDGIAHVGTVRCLRHLRDAVSQEVGTRSLRTCIVRGPWCPERGAARATPGGQAVTAYGCLQGMADHSAS